MRSAADKRERQNDDYDTDISAAINRELITVGEHTHTHTHTHLHILKTMCTNTHTHIPVMPIRYQLKGCGSRHVIGVRAYENAVKSSGFVRISENP